MQWIAVLSSKGCSARREDTGPFFSTTYLQRRGNILRDSSPVHEAPLQSFQRATGRRTRSCFGRRQSPYGNRKTVLKSSSDVETVSHETFRRITFIDSHLPSPLESRRKWITKNTSRRNILMISASAIRRLRLHRSWDTVALLVTSWGFTSFRSYVVSTWRGSQACLANIPRSTCLVVLAMVMVSYELIWSYRWSVVRIKWMLEENSTAVRNECRGAARGLQLVNVSVIKLQAVRIPY